MAMFTGQWAWPLFVLMGLGGVGGLAAALALSAKMTRQLDLLTNAARALRLGQFPPPLQPQRLYRELRPLAAHLNQDAAFQAEVLKILTEIVRGARVPPPSPSKGGISLQTSTQEGNFLELRSADDEFSRVVNGLIGHLAHLQQMAAAVAEGNLSGFGGGETALAAEQQIRRMITELSALVIKGRNYTNQIVRAGSQIDSITTQEFQDAKIVTKRVNEISQSIYQMAGNIQHVAEHLQKQTGVLGNTTASIEETMHSVEEIAQNVTYLKSIVEKSAPSFLASEKTGSALDLLYDATQAIEQDAQTCVRCSQEAAADAEQGKLAVRQTIAGINQIQVEMGEFFEIVRRLSERAEEVHEILDVIREIADHTNLLAMNAAIISAHAGEHGRDFAVIADEIGKFAERTHESSNEIGELLGAIRAEFREVTRAMEKSAKAVSASVERSDQAGQTLEKIAAGIFRTKDIVARIAAATAGQSSENEHIREIMRELVRAQKEEQEQVNRILWQLMETIAQIRGISSEQAEGNARIAAMTENLQRITQEIGQATTQHVATSNQIIAAVDGIRKLVHRMTLNTEKTTQLTSALFAQGGNLAMTMGEFVLTPRRELEHLAAGTPLLGFVKRGADTFFDYMAAGIRVEAARHGFHLVETNSQYEATMQVEDVNWLLKQPDLQGLILCPVDPHVARTLVQKSLERGIPCVTADESIPATITVRSGNHEGGQRAAELFREQLQPPAALGVIVDRTVMSMVRRAEGFRQRAELYPFEVVEIYCDISDPEQVKNYIVAGIAEYPESKGLFLPNERVTTAYLYALHEGLLPSVGLRAVGFDYTPLAEEAIRQGELVGAIWQHPEEIGKQAFQWLYKLIRKELRVEDVEVRTIYIPTVKMTKATLQGIEN